MCLFPISPVSLCFGLAAVWLQILLIVFVCDHTEALISVPSDGLDVVLDVCGCLWGFCGVSLS